ncbi:MAG: hypothetical protein BJ554DRAFT_1487 [Olpidium bornovanus]|uniref:Uncharacterized protein n=1 Tax=Olpidium bornovanus TaxID=278681 RepID=A0A8H7ZSA8_9FUNG|nr:MAG: hypothetical protein BJ554DRAFT_1487 [Olpidium bornovanus]
MGRRCHDEATGTLSPIDRLQQFVTNANAIIARYFARRHPLTDFSLACVPHTHANLVLLLS